MAKYGECGWMPAQKVTDNFSAGNILTCGENGKENLLMSSMVNVQLSASAPAVSDLNDLADAIKRLEKLYQPDKVIVPCSHCGQFGALYTACGHCGAPIG